MKHDPRAADALDAALDRNRARNVRYSLYDWRGGECIEGSLRRVGATRRQRLVIAAATRRHTGYLSHAEANDTAPDVATMRRTLRGVAARLRGTPAPVRLAGVDDALAAVAVLTALALALWAGLALVALVVFAGGIWVGQAIDYHHLEAWWARHRARALARRTYRARVAAARAPIVLGPVAVTPTPTQLRQSATAPAADTPSEQRRFDRRRGVPGPPPRS